MADFTRVEYVSTTLAYANENRDNPSANRKWREDDVINALNLGRHTMLCEVGLGLYRKQSTVNATTGDITPPVDFFSAGCARFQASSTTKPVRLIIKTAISMDQDLPGWEETAAGTPNTLVLNLKTTGLVARLHPQPTATITNGLIWDYTARLTDLDADDDKCPIMNLFPEFQMLMLQSAALRILYMLEGGEADDQVAKWDKVYNSQLQNLRTRINRLFLGNGTLFGGVS